MDIMKLHFKTLKENKAKPAQSIIFKSIREVKDHLEEMKYHRGYEFIIHFKLDRNSSNEISERSYHSDKI